LGTRKARTASRHRDRSPFAVGKADARQATLKTLCTQRPDAFEEAYQADCSLIERFGFTNPVLVADDGVIIAGYGVEAAKLLPMDGHVCRLGKYGTANSLSLRLR